MSVGVATLFLGTAVLLSLAGWLPLGAVFSLVGVGMGFVGLATILVVQNSVDNSHLGVATASHQFTRNLGATVGIGICGSVFTAGFATHLNTALEGNPPASLPATLADRMLTNADSILRPEVRDGIPPEVLGHLSQAVAHGVLLVFWIGLAAALACLVCCLLLPRENR